MLDFVNESIMHANRKSGVMPLGALLEGCLLRYGNIDASIYEQPEWGELVSRDLVDPKKSFNVRNGAVLPRD